MKKLIVCLFLGLVILSGMIWAEGLRLSFEFQSFSIEKEMEEGGVEIYERIEGLWTEKYFLQNLKTEERFQWAYLKAEYKLYPIAVYAIGGLGKSNIDFIGPTTNSLVIFTSTDQRSTNPKEWPGKEAENDLGFIYGGGINLTAFRKNGFSILLNAEIVMKQKKQQNMFLFKDDYTYLMYGEYAWYKRQAEIQNIKEQRILFSFVLNQEFDKVNLSIGPLLIFSKSHYQAHYLNDYGWQDFFHGSSYQMKQEAEFEFELKNKKKLGGFIKVGYKPTKCAEFWIKTLVGPETGISTGLTINL